MTPGSIMRGYEIRVLGKDGRFASIFSNSYDGNASVIQMARRIAKERAFEIWIGSDCIYPDKEDKPDDICVYRECPTTEQRTARVLPVGLKWKQGR